ncbi:hypothetical protein [Leptolyngbya sp. DQ-M1]|uniref:hypothetical protein n=1 Tax=Leptolyngbya sp. DQ-M1 TaxID=2933920 RepID=UPI003297D447
MPCSTVRQGVEAVGALGLLLFAELQANNSKTIKGTSSDRVARLKRPVIPEHFLFRRIGGIKYCCFFNREAFDPDRSIVRI